MKDEHFIRRCFDLARLGAGQVSPNPMVGAILVHQNKIIGEGWHQKYGGPHAEVNALSSVSETDRHLIPKSTLYVSLEPCCIFGRTPPCTNLILENKIPKVVISAIDLTPEVKGQGLTILRQAGVDVVTGVMQKEGEELAAIRNTFVSQKRPYIYLKFAQSKDGFFGKKGEQVWISNPYSKRLVHRLRAECDAILVGTNTVLVDNPQLTNRLWWGKSPIRIFLDRTNKVDSSHKIFSEDTKTFVFTENRVTGSLNDSKTQYFKLSSDKGLIHSLLSTLHEQNISTLIVEGGAQTLRNFIEIGVWDEAWVFSGEKSIHDGIPAPKIPLSPISVRKIGTDVLTIFRNQPDFR